MPSVLDESNPTRDNTASTPTQNGSSKKSDKGEPSKAESGSAGVVDPNGNPWTSATAKKMKGATKMVPYAIAGIVGLAAVGTGYVMMARRRERERSLKGRVMQMLGSAMMRQIVSGLGGVAVGAATSMAKSAISKRLSAQKDSVADEAPLG